MSIIEQINSAIEQYEKENDIVMSDEERKSFADKILSGLGLKLENE
jgi:vacuolar-type H+-ATPase subunit E/Vma4